MLVSDNGASGEGGPNGSVNENKIFNGLPDTIEEALKYVDELGSPKTYNHYPTGWAWAFNTPFKMWKRYASYQGGTADPMIVSWPAQIKDAGHPHPVHARGRHRPDDLRLLGVEMPEVVNGFTQHPLEGESFAASLHDADAKGKQTQFYSMLGTRGDLPRWLEGRIGDAGGTERLGRVRQPALGAVQHRDRPERVPRPRRASTRRSSQELIALWWAEAGKYGALPLESRDAIGILSRRGRSSPSRATATSTTRTVQRCPSRSRRTSATAPTRSRSRCRSTRPRRAASCSRRARASAATRSTSRTASSSTSTTGSASSSRSSSPPSPSRPASACSRRPSRRRATRCRPKGTLSLYIDEEKVGEAKIKTQPGKFSLAGEGLNVGKEGAEPVTDDYPGSSPWAFVGGTIHQAIVDVAGEPWVDLEAELAGAFARD